MAIAEGEARKLVIKAGIELINKKLIARTWGNISARVSDTEFVITPSGMAYETLKESDLVKVKIEDLSYDGDIKPSSEKGIHAAAYKLRPDIDFVIHTHQNYATAISIEANGQDFAPIAKYGLPGTKKLKKNVSAVIFNNPEKCSFLLERHGAIVLGKTYDDAFNKADELEALSKEHYEKFAKEKPCKTLLKPYLDDYAQMFGLHHKPVENDQTALDLITTKNQLAARYANKAKSMQIFDIFLQNVVFKLKYSKLKNKK